jgi:5'-nucleotidase
VNKVLYVDMDGVLADFDLALEQSPAEIRREYDGHPDDIPGIFGRMLPVPGAIEAYRELSQLFDTYILSTAPWDNPSGWSDKLLWVKQHLGGDRDDVAYKRLILTHHKNLLRGDFLIDDRTKNGAREFKGELIVFGSAGFPDWPAVLRYLKAAV